MSNPILNLQQFM